MSLRVYYDLMSQPSRAVYLFLKVANIPFESCTVKLRDGEHFEEAFTKINPFQKVPVIDDAGFKLTESVAILRYLVRSRNVANHWYSTDLQLQAKVDEYLEWQHLNTRLFCAMYFRHKFLEPMMFNRPVEEKKVARFQKEMEKCLEVIENIWLDHGKKDFITGPNISVADLLACCELEQPGMAGYDVFQKHPIIGAYRERVRKATEPHYEEAHKIVRIVTHKFLGVPRDSKL
uniref:glutathione transferase n=1 Tax=Daphnia magna TaxID=35525 RepID=A0A482DHN0_9CRUS|nr:glutathione S-transferase theta [Daphnia magna]